MTKVSLSDFNRDEADASGLLRALANEALARVVSETRGDPFVDYISTIDTFGAAVLSDDPEARNSIVARLVDQGVTAEKIISNYAPDTARHLGDLWGKNEISFVDVTIGVARLQETVRILSSRRSRLEYGPDTPQVLLIVPAEEDHIYGGLTAALDFEKVGCEVTFAVGHSLSELVSCCTNTNFDMIAVSSSSRRNVRNVQHIIATLRKSLRNPTSFVVGGRLTEMPDLDLIELTEADYVTSDVATALKFCGITLSDQGVPLGEAEQ